MTQPNNPHAYVQWAARTPAGRIALADDRAEAYRFAQMGVVRRTVVYRTNPSGPWIVDTTPAP